MNLPTRRIWQIFKTILALVIVIAVSRNFYRLLSADALENLSRQPDWVWCTLAGLLYLAAHTLWGTFWVQLLWQQGAQLRWTEGIRIYFISQFGKYVPGKAWVIFLRIVLLRGHQYSPTMIGLTATYETLTNMAAGAALAVVLLPWAGVVGDISLGRTLVLGALGLLPLGLVVLHRVTLRLAKKAMDSQHYRGPSFQLILRGFAQAVFGWALLALSLTCLCEAWPATSLPWSRDVYLSQMVAVCLSYVIGFVVLITPGGLGAREAILQQILEHQWILLESPASTAAFMAVMLRLTWTVAEVLLAGSLWLYSLWLTTIPKADQRADHTMGVPT